MEKSAVREGLCCSSNLILNNSLKSAWTSDLRLTSGFSPILAGENTHTHLSWSEWEFVHTGMWDTHTHTFPELNENLCLFLPSALIPLGTSVFQGKRHLSCWQAADWFLVSVKCDRLMENEYYFYSTCLDKGTPCLVIKKIYLLTISETTFCVPPLTQIDMIIVIWKKRNLIEFQ